MESDENNNVLCTKSTCHITLLNSLCLINIFQHLSMMDLINVSQVHSAFNDIINHVICQILFSSEELSKYYSIEMLLQTYGASIRVLQLDFKNLGPTILHKTMLGNDIIFEFIARYCTKLRKLHVKLNADYHIDSDILQRAAPVLNSLESIEIRFDFFYRGNNRLRSNVNSVLRSCPNLREVKIGDRIDTYESLAQFTQLTSFEVDLSSREIFQLKTVLERNSQIKKLSVSGLHSSNLPILSDLVLMAEMNRINDLSLQWCKQVLPLSTYRDDTEKRLAIRRAMVAFTSLKRISFKVVDTKEASLISDILTSLPNITECTFVGSATQAITLSSITKKLKILRIESNMIRLTKQYYQKLLYAKRLRENHCLQVFISKKYFTDIGKDYKPEQLKIIQF